MWDKIACWPSADVGEAVSIPCPKYLFFFSGNTHPRKNRVPAAAAAAEAVLRSGAPGSPGERGFCVGRSWRPPGLRSSAPFCSLHGFNL